MSQVHQTAGVISCGARIKAGAGDTASNASERTSKRSKPPPVPARHHPRRTATKVLIFANGNVHLELHDGRLMDVTFNAFQDTIKRLRDLGLVDANTRLWIESMHCPPAKIFEATWLVVRQRQ